MTNRLEPRAQVVPNPASFFNDVILFTPLEGGKVDVNKGDTIETVDPLASNEKYYTFRATDDELRALMHQLKHYFREDKDETYVDGKLLATEKHLADMRALVFDVELNITNEKRTIDVDPVIYKTEDDRPINQERE